MCGSRGGPPGLLVPNKPQGFCGRKALLNQPVYGSGREPLSGHACTAFRHEGCRNLSQCVDLGREHESRKYYTHATRRAHLKHPNQLGHTNNNDNKCIFHSPNPFMIQV